jgi:hypothetical protein
VAYTDVSLSNSETLNSFVAPQLYPDADYKTLQQTRQMYESVDKFINDCFDRRILPEIDMTLHKGE